MIKNRALLASLLFSLCTLSVFASETSNQPNNLNETLPISISVVNASGKNFCIQDAKGDQCTNSPSKEFIIQPQYFYERSGIIRVSIGDQPFKIAMIKKGVQQISLYIDNSGKIHLPSGVFEKGSFIYSDNRDYLYFAAKPNALFSAYPV